MAEVIEQETTHARLQAVNEAISSGMFVQVRQMLHAMPASDAALILESSPPKGRAVLWQLLDPEQHGEVLEELSEDVKNSILQQMDPEHVAAAAEGMEIDNLAYLLRSLPDTVFQEVIAAMDAQDQQRVEQALSYQEDSAGSLMNTDFVTLRPDVSVDVVLRYLRLKGELPDATDSLYVVNEQNILIGKVPLSVLLTSMPSALVGDIMDTAAEALPIDMPDDEVANRFERQNWISAAVVDEEQRLVGRITIDDVVDIIRENAEHSMMSMAGLDDEEDTFAPIMKSAKRRSIWLGINLLTALVAAAVSNMFEDILSQLAAVAVLMTIVPSMGGIAGSQTLTLVVRGIALGHVGPSNSRWLIIKEMTVGLLNGLLWACLIALVVVGWKGNWTLGAIIAFAMFINLAAAGLSGALIPLGMKKLNIDPALAGSVVLTTITDVIGLLAFLGSASLLLQGVQIN